MRLDSMLGIELEGMLFFLSHCPFWIDCLFGHSLSSILWLLWLSEFFVFMTIMLQWTMYYLVCEALAHLWLDPFRWIIIEVVIDLHVVTKGVIRWISSSSLGIHKVMIFILIIRVPWSLTYLSSHSLIDGCSFCHLIGLIYNCFHVWWLWLIYFRSSPSSHLSHYILFRLMIILTN